jgi:hypothetical protein
MPRKRSGPPPFYDPDEPSPDWEPVMARMRGEHVPRLPEPVVEWIKRFSPFYEKPANIYLAYSEAWEAELESMRGHAPIPAPTTPLKRLTLEAWVAAAVKRFPRGPVEPLKAWSRRLLCEAEKDGFRRTTAASIETRIHEMLAEERREKGRRR